MNDKHRKEFEKAEREPVSEQGFKEALGLLLPDKTNVNFENEEMIAKELNQRYELKRRKQAGRLWALTKTMP